MRRHGLAISSNKPHTQTHTHTHTHAHTHTHTHTHTSSHETRGNQSVVLPPANCVPPGSSSPLVLDPPQTPIRTIPPPLHHRHKHLRLLMGCLLLCVSKRLVVLARRQTHSCAAEPSSCVYIFTHTHTHTHMDLADFTLTMNSRTSASLSMRVLADTGPPPTWVVHRPWARACHVAQISS